MTLLMVLFGLGVAGLCVIVAANKTRAIDYADIDVRQPDRPLGKAGPELSVLTWNIGYGALGKDADVYIDGGTSLRALSSPQVISATSAIARTLSETPADLICIQEIAKAGFLTRNVDVQRAIDEALPDCSRYFWGDLKTVLLPRRLGISNGMATYCAKQASACSVAKLPFATAHMLGFIKKPYVGLLNRLPILGTDKTWVVINIHLPFFKTTDAERAAQLAGLFSLAKKEYENGNHVIIAGDWNARLCPTSFEHTTDPRFLTAFKDFPVHSLPTDWHIKIDPDIPTVRALNAAYRSRQTYTTIIDGFVVSPNVHVLDIHTSDLGFAHSDHQPVNARFSIRK